MNDPQSTKILQAILNGQSATNGKIDKLDKKLTEKIDEVEQRLDKKMDRLERNLTKRIDNLGTSLAYLEDDAPTREEHDKLVKRVNRLEQKVIPQSA